MIIMVTMIDDGHPSSELMDLDKFDPSIPAHVELKKAILDSLADSSELDFEYSLFNSSNDYSAATIKLPFTGTVDNWASFYVESE
jgi:hypothetical protein